MRRPSHLPALHPALPAEPGWPGTPPPNVQAAGLAWPPTLGTNIYDVSWTFNMR